MINSVEDAQEYIKEVDKSLNYLRKLSAEAGLNRHAAMWCGICGSLHHSAQAMENMVDAVIMQVHLMLEEDFKVN